jgi:hypothetical protein
VEVQALARAETVANIQALIRIRDDENSPPAAVVAAVCVMFDRAFGKPKQEVESTGPDGGPISYVIRAPRPVESTAEWLRIYAPKTIDAEAENEGKAEAENAGSPAAPSPLATPVEPVAQPSSSPASAAWLKTHEPKGSDYGR